MPKHNRLNIYSLCKSLSYTQIVQTGLFSRISQDGKKSELFFRKIHEGVIIDDASAIDILNYTSKNSFKKFKNRFVENIKNYALITELESKSSKDDKTEDLQKKMWKEHALANILQKSGQGKNAIALYKQVLSNALKFEYIDLMLLTVIKLKTHYAFIQPNKKLYNHYKIQFDFCKHHADKFMKAEHYYNEISHFNIFRDLVNKQELIQLCFSYYEDLVRNFEKEDFSKYRISAYKIGIFGSQLDKDTEKALRISHEALDFLRKKANSTNLEIYMIKMDILRSYLLDKDYTKTIDTIQSIEDLRPSRNFNYFNLQNIKSQVYIIQHDWDRLYELTYYVMSIKEIKNYPRQYEQWKLKEAFVQYLVLAGKISQQLLKQKPLRPFRLNRFINEMRLFGKEKRGSNIAILVVQLLFFLYKKDYGKVAERLDALTQYTYRYLRNNDTFRSNCFIKMLLKIPEAQYNYIRTQRYVSKYDEKLKKRPFEVSLHSTDMEIIPYEQLWEIVIDLLRRNK